MVKLWGGVDELIEEAKATLDRERQMELYAKIQKKIMHDLPAYPIVAKDIVLARQPWVDPGYEVKTSVTYHYSHEKMKLLEH